MLKPYKRYYTITVYSEGRKPLSYSWVGNLQVLDEDTVPTPLALNSMEPDTIKNWARAIKAAGYTTDPITGKEYLAIGGEKLPLSEVQRFEYTALAKEIGISPKEILMNCSADIAIQYLEEQGVDSFTIA
jgi:hypothetical protein